MSSGRGTLLVLYWRRTLFFGVINICLTNLRLNLNSWNKCEHIFNQLSYYTAYPIKITCICFEIERWLRYEWVSDQRILVFMQEPYWMVNVVSQTAGVGFGGVVRCNCCNSVLFCPSLVLHLISSYDHKATYRKSFANARYLNCIELCCVCWISSSLAIWLQVHILPPVLKSALHMKRQR